MLRKDDVILYPIEEKHVPFMVKWGNLGGLRGQCISKKRTNVAEQTEYLKAIAFNDSKELLVVYIKSNDQPVGVCEIYSIDWQNRACFINLFLEDKQNVVAIHGFKIISLLLEYLFRKLGLYKVSVDILLENSIEISLFKQHDFKLEVKKRKHAFLDGKFKTVLEMSLLKHEFEKHYG